MLRGCGPACDDNLSGLVDPPQQAADDGFIRVVAALQAEIGDRPKFKQLNHWQAHSGVPDRTYHSFERTYAIPFSQWARKHISGDSVPVVFYPFGGPDCVFPHLLYPDADIYILCALSRARSHRVWSTSIPRYFTSATQISVEWLSAELSRYSPDMLIQLSARVRREHDLSTAVEKLEKICDQAITGFAFAPRQQAEFAAYLEQLVKDADSLWGQTNSLKKRLAALHASSNGVWGTGVVALKRVMKLALRREASSSASTRVPSN